MNKVSTLVGGIALGAVIMQAQGPSPDGMWQPITGPTDKVRAFGAELGPTPPATFAAFRLSAEQLQKRLSGVNRELTNDSPVISLPMPNSTYLDFRVQETEVMPKELSDSLRFKTYRGQSIRNARVTTRFEFGPEGLRAVVFTANGRVFVEPVTRPEPAYVSYAGLLPEVSAAPQADNNPPRCQVTPVEAQEMRARVRGAGRRPDGPPPTPEPPGTLVRSFRLAMGATGEYTAFHGGTVDKALRAIGATVQRVNEVYENDLGITFRLVSNERDLIYTDPNTDPYTNNDADKLLQENQRVLDSKVGGKNYDIGHVLSTGAGGKAFAGVCDAGFKGQGATGRAKPVGDPFDIDYVAHEMGHQLGANHTFNSTLGHCSGNRFAATAFEPGSGSTVLAYAGICNAGDLQLNSHPYFHAATLREIRDYVAESPGNTCGTPAATSNTPPVVSVKAASVTIPVGTPFHLTGSATDKEQGSLLFGWEELDLGPSAPPEDDADGHARPLFRSYVPHLISTRVFPALDVIRSGNPRLGETLPITARTMAFRLTARDAANPAGGFGFADVQVKVVKSGPLSVTQPAANATVSGGASVPIVWNVNGTDGGEVACTNVTLRLSLDDAASIAHELVMSTPNDGSEAVTIPPGATATRARVFVECVSQPFFAISGPFTIKSPS